MRCLVKVAIATGSFSIADEAAMEIGWDGKSRKIYFELFEEDIIIIF